MTTEPERVLRGPYETEAEARADAAPIYEVAAGRASQRGSLTGPNASALIRALGAADVRLGAYDQEVVLWVAGWEPELVTAVVGWIARANGGAR